MDCDRARYRLWGSAMATGIAPLLIGLAPVTIALIIASLYSLLWYYILLPFGLAVYANNANNFDSSEEQLLFQYQSKDYLETLYKIHKSSAEFIFLSTKVGIRGLVSYAKNLLTHLYRLLTANLAAALVGLVMIVDFLDDYSSVFEIFYNEHFSYLIIDLALSVVSFVNSYLATTMLVLNAVGAIVYGIAQWWMSI
ncbi:MAG: hypothetical protein D6732_04750 [Methanobacteriota archaeon]|nr:MAG: hypothetical protein D6732_04750 [Euryarchaeota archaeon]